MKSFFRKIKQSLAAAAAFVAAAGFVSCNSLIYDDLDPCPQGVALRFVYDYNMEFANAFPSQVHCLTLLIYDAKGNYIGTRTETSANLLGDENWRMKIDLPAGSYHFVAYGGLECSKSSFHFVKTPASGNNLSSLQVELNADAINADPGLNLHPLFYGNLNVAVPADGTDYTEATLYMLRDTNNIRIVLQNTSGDKIEDNDFVFTITDNNILMNFNNNIVPVASPLVYNPFATGSSVVGANAADATPFYAAYAEFSVGRLVTTNSPRLTITRKSDGEKVFSIPLLEYLELLRSEQFSKMPLQEYLDRENTWNMIFFLDDSNNWIKTQIVINDWIVRINNIPGDEF